VSAPAAVQAQPAEVFARAREGAAALRRLTVAERLARLAALRAVVLARREEVVDRVVRDTGKSRTDALVSEVFGVLDNLAWLEKHAPAALADERVATPIALTGKKSRIFYEPLGTVLVIAPWNYPFYQALVPICCAVAAGNAVVHKPSEWTPLTGLVEDLLAQAGFPPEWVQVVYGDGAVGAELLAQRPDKVLFTGSTRTGRAVLKAAAQGLVPVELELGGKDAMIVFDDVDVTRAAAGAAWGGLTTSGQSCTSVERLYVQDGVYDGFLAELVEVARAVRTSDADDADLGAMTTPFQVEVVARHVADAKAKGAVFHTGGDWDGRSPLIPPMVVDHLTDDMLLMTEETFGPLLPLQRFGTEQEALALANDSEFGLTASVWTADGGRADRVARALRVGGVSINNVMATEANPGLPFGGLGSSGFGRYKGVHGLRGLCTVKSVLVDRNSGKVEANWFPYTAEKYRLFTDLITSLFGTRRSLPRFAVTGLRLERHAQRAARRG
jgi:aldehyde dehydrogenase (NAD+)